jgi:hypothetical protein
LLKKIGPWAFSVVAVVDSLANNLPDLSKSRISTVLSPPFSIAEFRVNVVSPLLLSALTVRVATLSPLTRSSTRAAFAFA